MADDVEVLSKLPSKFSAALKILPEKCRFIRYLVNYWLKPNRRESNGIRRSSIDEIGNVGEDVFSCRSR